MPLRLEKEAEAGVVRLREEVSSEEVPINEAVHSSVAGVNMPLVVKAILLAQGVGAAGLLQHKTGTSGYTWCSICVKKISFHAVSSFSRRSAVKRTRMRWPIWIIAQQARRAPFI